MESCGAAGRTRPGIGRSAVIISHEKLIAEAETTGFRPELLEKLAQLLGILNALGS